MEKKKVFLPINCGMEWVHYSSSISCSQIFFFQCTNKEFLAEEMCVCPIQSDPSREHK